MPERLARPKGIGGRGRDGVRDKVSVKVRDKYMIKRRVRVKVMDMVKEVVREKNGDADIVRDMDKEKNESINADSVRVVVCGCFYLP